MKARNKNRIIELLILITAVSSIFSYGCEKNDKKEIISTTIAPVIVEHGPRDKKIIALTFDADMTTSMLRKLQTKEVKSLYDERIIEILNNTSTPATIFITGLWAQTYIEETKSISENPLFEIANHSLTHGSFTKNCYTLEQVKNKNIELIETQKILQKITNITPQYFRFPGGCYEKEDLQIIADAKLIPVQWDVISGDAFQKDHNKIANTVINKTTNGSIIVMHLNGAPNAPGTAEALPSIISELKKKGYSFVKLSELLNGSL